MDILLRVAGVQINLPSVNAYASVAGMFGVGGGFLPTTVPMMVGIPSAVAVASESKQIVAVRINK